MKRRTTVIFSIMLIALFATGALAMGVKEKSDFTGSIKIEKNDKAALLDLAKISLVTAIEAALKQVPGTALKARLENENGFLVYSVKIVKPDHLKVNVMVDAGNGTILKTETYDKDNKRQGEKEDDNHEGAGKKK